jgi:hypothetical protein
MTKTDALRMVQEAAFKEGSNYALFELSKRLHIDSKDIRLSKDTTAAKADKLAKRIVESLCNGGQP